MYLGVKLSQRDYDVTGDFTCKWKDIEEALYKAIGKEQNVTRLSNFLDKNYTNFKDQPLEILFDLIDTEDHNAGECCLHGTTPPDEATLEPGAKFEQLAMLPTSPVLDKSRG